MSNKEMSELSNPVDFLKSAALITARNFERWSKLAAMTSETSSVLHSATLLETSQLLSALLAELEAKDKRMAELEAKLATPVRLPEPYQTSCGANELYLCPVEVADSIRAAGFTFTVEGDE